VDEISATDLSIRARIPVAQPIGIDGSLDGSRLYVGTDAQSVATIDPVTAQVIATTFLPGFDAPRIPLVLNNGNVLLISGPPGQEQDFVGEGTNGILWNPATNVFQTPPSAGLFAAGPIARSADGSKVVVGGFSYPSQVAVYDTATNAFVVSASFPNPIVAVAANSNGTQFAATDQHTMYFFDGKMAQIGSVSIAADLYGMAYTADNRYLYGRWAGPGNPRLFVLDATQFQIVGYVPGPFSSFAPFPVGQNQNGNLIVIDPSNAGVGLMPFNPLSTLDAGPTYPPYPQWTPGQAIPGQSISTELSGNGFETGQEVFFGSVGVAIDSLVTGPGGQVTVQAPALNAGPVNVVFQFPDGWNMLLPQSFSYGPTALQLTESEGPPGSPITLIGYGFNFPLSQLQVTMGGKRAILYSTSTTSGITTSYPADQVTFFAPSGLYGPVDITLNTPVGSATIHNGFQYTQKAAVFPTPANLSQVIYDSTRNLVFATSGNARRLIRLKLP